MRAERVEKTFGRGSATPAVELTVLGASSRYLAPLGAGTSYLLRHGETRVLLDCGNGTHLRLAETLRGAPLSGVLVSHFHADNVADLLPVLHGLPPEAPLIAPRGAAPRLGEILRERTAARSPPRASAGGGRLVAVGRGATVDVGELRLTFSKGAHGCPGVVTRVEAPDACLVYAGDTGARPWLADFARGADLLVAHTLLLDRDAGDARATNLSAGDAGRLARDAGAARLAVSHAPFYRNAEEGLAEARAAFGGEVVLLREGQRLVVGATIA